MAIILIDTCVITDLADTNSAWFEWSAATLERLDQNNTMVINPIIYAECSVGFERIEEVEALFEHLNFAIKPMPKEALFLAGKVFLQYKKRKGGKTNVLPDFFIGAHAAIANYQLMTRDKGRFSSYFPSINLIMPGSPTELN
ncbi:DNA-binding protein [Methyloprofundus sedimenti]|uniref:DNA-binding protein n=1 Tax=Methyloprofundus sedimenti TaxID=1420851 RepID=A0A1V8M1H6_9GAMM|nr:PIN domain-containing protein [Methyloprofundus sedimenti]OQK15395.1 DNA-binding protein [Methyloprofundus sedimenti]